IDHRGRTTPLIRDVADVLARHLALLGVTEIAWDRYPHDLVADALVVARRVPAAGRPNRDGGPARMPSSKASRSTSTGGRHDGARPDTARESSAARPSQTE